jgi:hypothetical protein
MIKEKDIVMTEKGKVAVVEIIHGDVAGVRLYNSNVRLIVGLNGLRRHKWLND